jgi:hypothetical protein
VKLFSDVLELPEVVARKLTSNKIASEALTLIESTARTTSTILIEVVSDVLAIVETLVKRLWSIKVIDELIIMVEGIARRLTSLRVVSEIMQFVETAVRWLPGMTVRVIEDVIQIGKEFPGGSFHRRSPLKS